MATTRADSQTAPAPTRRLAFAILGSRAEPHLVGYGQVEITSEGPESRRLLAQLTDISKHGFRFTYQGDLMSSGTVIAFHHQFLQGRGRLMWSYKLKDHNEGGCLVIRNQRVCRRGTE